LKRLFFPLIMIVMCFLCGCGEKTNAKSEVDLKYDVDFKDMQMVYPLSVDGEFLFHDDQCVFRSLSYTDVPVISYYSKKLTDDSEPMELGISINAETFIAECLSDNLYILSETETGFSVTSFDLTGKKNDYVEIEDPGFEHYPTSMGVYDDGLFVISDSKSICFFERTGELVNSLQVDGYILKRILASTETDNTYVLASSENEGVYENVILEINRDKYDINDIPIQKKADALTVYNNSIYYAADNYIYHVDMSNHTNEALIGLTDYKLQYSDLCNVFGINNEYIIIKRSPSSSIGDIYKEVVIYPSDSIEDNEVVNLIFYDPYSISDFCDIGEIIASFNEDNPDIHIDIKEYDRELNYVLASDEKPDFVIGHENRIGELGKKGYLCDLSEMFLLSENISEEDFLDGLVEKMKYEGKIYGLPRTITIRTLGGAESKVGCKPGWTSDEFFEWLILRPEALEGSWMQKEDILRICLEGNLSSFDDNDYTKLLEKVNKVTTYNKEGMTLDYYADIISIGCSSFIQISTLDSDFDGMFTLKGYPSVDGNPRYILEYIAVGILENCKNKDAAFKFVEYYVKYGYGDPGALYSTKKLLNWAKNASGTINLNNDPQFPKRVYMTEEQLNRPISALPYLTVISERDNEIIDIIVEESSAYFSGNKTLDDTADIIKRRVDIYIEENS